MNINKIRNDMEIKKVYMNNSSISIPPKPVISAIKNYFDSINKYGPVPPWKGETFISEAKNNIAKLIGSNSDEIVFTLNGSEAINIISNGIDLKQGDNIILSELRFMPNAIPWMKLKEIYGIEIKIVKGIKPGVIDLNHLKSLIDNNTRLISIDHMLVNLGIIQPIKEIGKMFSNANMKQPLFFLNACNTIGLIDINVKEIDCDFMVAVGRKYLRGPAGTAFLYIKKNHITNIRPSFISYNTGEWNFSKNTYQDSEAINRFMPGEANIPGIIGLNEAVEYLFEIGGFPQIEDRVNLLTDYLLRNLRSISNIEIYGPESLVGRAGLVAFNIKNMKPIEVTKLLYENDIVVQPFSRPKCPGPLDMYGVDSVVRLSLHYWNTEKEIDKVVNTLKQI